MDPQQSQQFGAAIAGMMGIFIICWLLFMAFASFARRIFTKAGMAGPLSFFSLQTPASAPLIVVCILAFGEWKVVPVAQYAPLPPAYPPPPSYPQPSNRPLGPIGKLHRGTAAALRTCSIFALKPNDTPRPPPPVPPASASPLAHRRPARRYCLHRLAELPLRRPARRTVHPPHRRHRPRPLRRHIRAG